MSTEVATRPDDGGIMERVLLVGDLARLQPQERVMYYNKVCESVGLNPLTRPFEYINLNGKLTLYANRSASEQLRKINGVSIEKLERETTEGIYVVTSYARDKTGRTDSSIGAVPIQSLKGEALANAIMKAETKSKRRVTLSICGLGWLDETEVDSIPGAQRVEAASVESAPAPKPARAPVKMVEAPPAAAPAPEPPKPSFALEPEVVQTPDVAQPTPPEDEQRTPVDPVEVVGTTPMTRETMQAIFRRVAETNKAKGPGTAQKVIMNRHRDGRPVNRLSEEEGRELVSLLEKAMA